jgi:hypothetical protein
VSASCFEVELQDATAKVRTTGTMVKKMLAMGFLLGVDGLGGSDWAGGGPLMTMVLS